MRKIFLLIISSLIIFNNTLLGQVPQPVENYPSPNAASLGIYGEVPVSLYTGVPNISIPIHNIKQNDASIPISIDYHLSSVKVNSHPGWLGLGWNLSAGGAITRRVRGLPDEMRSENGHASGFYAHSHKIKDIRTVEDLSLMGENMQAMEGTEFELMADEFSFNFCGYSGSFYFNEDRGWTVISDQDIKVIFDPLDDGFLTLTELRENINVPKSRWMRKKYNTRFLNQFTLITPDGVMYKFGGVNATEYSISYYNRISSDLIATTWNLVEIITPEDWRIKFDYEPGDPICEIGYSPSTRTLYNMQCQSINGNNKPHTVSNGFAGMTGFLIFPVYLKKIESELEVIDFITDRGFGMGPSSVYLAWSRSGLFSPMNTFAKQMSDPNRSFGLFLNITDLYDSEKQYQSAVFQRLNWRRLQAISIKPKYPPLSLEGPIDIAKTYYFSYITDGHMLLSEISERKGSYKLVWNDPNHPSAKPQSESGPNLRTSEMGPPIKVMPPMPKDYKPKEYKFRYHEIKDIDPLYFMSKTDSWGFYKGGKDKLSDYPDYRAVYPSEYYTKNGVLLEIRYPTGGRTVFDYELNDYSKCVSESFTSLTDKSGKAGGLRISKLTSYTFNRELAYIKKYYYTKEYPVSAHNKGKSSGILSYIPTYVSNIGFDGWVCSENLHEECDETKASLQNKSKGGFISRGTNNNSPHVSYSTVIEETIGKDGNSNGFTKYKYSNYDEDIWGESHGDEPLSFSTYSGSQYYDQLSSKSTERGKLINEEHYDSNKQLIRSVKYKYKKSKETNNYFNTIFQQYIVICSGTTYAKLSSVFKTYTYSYLLDSKIETFRDPGTNTEMQSTKYKYTYNKNKMISSESVWDSNNKEIKTEYKYVADIATNGFNSSSLGNICFDLALSNRLNKPVEIIKYKDGKVVSADVHIYNRRGTVDALYSLETTTPLTDYIPFSTHNTSTYIMDNRCKLQAEYQYDQKNNLVHIKEKNGSTIYLWGGVAQISRKNLFPEMIIKHITPEQLNERYGIDALNYNGLSGNINYPSIQKAEDLFITYLDYNSWGDLTAKTDEKGKTTLYKYDILRRLKEVSIVEDGKKKVIEAHNYDYK